MINNFNMDKDIKIVESDYFRDLKQQVEEQLDLLKQRTDLEVLKNTFGIELVEAVLQKDKETAKKLAEDKLRELFLSLINTSREIYCDLKHGFAKFDCWSSVNCTVVDESEKDKEITDLTNTTLSLFLTQIFCYYGCFLIMLSQTRVGRRVRIKNHTEIGLTYICDNKLPFSNVTNPWIIKWCRTTIIKNYKLN